MKSLLLPLAIALAAASMPAIAGEHHGDAARHACPMHDDSLSAEERAKAMDEMFAKLDADKDGAISRAEFDDHHAKMREKHDGKDAHAH